MICIRDVEAAVGGVVGDGGEAEIDGLREGDPTGIGSRRIDHRKKLPTVSAAGVKRCSRRVVGGVSGGVVGHELVALALDANPEIRKTGIKSTGRITAIHRPSPWNVIRAC